MKQIKSALLYTGRGTSLGDLCLDFEVCLVGSFFDFWGPIHIWKPPCMEAHIAQHWWTVPVHLQDLQIQCVKGHIYMWMNKNPNHWLMENSGKTKKGWKRLRGSRDTYTEMSSAFWDFLQEWGEYFTAYLTRTAQLCLETVKSYGYSPRCWTHLKSPVQLSTPSLLCGKLDMSLAQIFMKCFDNWPVNPEVWEYSYQFSPN